MIEALAKHAHSILKLVGDLILELLMSLLVIDEPEKLRRAWRPAAFYLTRSHCVLDLVRQRLEID